MRKKIRNIIAIALSGTLIAALLGYMTFWHIVAGQIEKEIAYQFERAAAQDIIITGGFPEITGFPRPHRVIFSGRVAQEDWALSLPRLEVTGFPLPGQLIEIALPEGAALTGPGVGDRDLWSLNYVYMTGIIPENSPHDLTVEALRTWRTEEGAIELQEFKIQKEPLQLSGTGRFRLDNNLQPEGEMNVRIEGHMAFLGYLQRKELIETKEALITATVLSGLSKQDPETGERYLETPLTLQNRKLLLGPLQLFDLPLVQWNYDTPPARPQ